MGQQGVLLGLVEAVDFVDQEDGAGAPAPGSAGPPPPPAQVRHSGHHGAEADELGVRPGP